MIKLLSLFSGVRLLARALKPLFTGEYKPVALEEKLEWLRITASKNRLYS